MTIRVSPSSTPGKAGSVSGQNLAMQKTGVRQYRSGVPAVIKNGATPGLVAWMDRSIRHRLTVTSGRERPT